MIEQAMEIAYPIETARLVLRPFHDGDLDALARTLVREDVNRFLYSLPRTREEVQASLVERQNRTVLRARGDSLLLAIELRSSGELAGDVLLQWLDSDHLQGEIGFVLHPDFHGRGIAAEASLEMLRVGFERAGLHRVIGRCDARNLASARVLRKLGMREEGLLRENELVKGEWTDELVFAMLADEWAARSAG